MLYDQYKHKIGRHLNGVNVGRGIGLAGKLIDITRILQKAPGRIGDTAKKVDVDKLDHILGIVKKVHHVATAPVREGLHTDYSTGRPAEVIRPSLVFKPAKSRRNSFNEEQIAHRIVHGMKQK